MRICEGFRLGVHGGLNVAAVNLTLTDSPLMKPRNVIVPFLSFVLYIYASICTCYISTTLSTLPSLKAWTIILSALLPTSQYYTCTRAVLSTVCMRHFSFTGFDNFLVIFVKINRFKSISKRENSTILFHQFYIPIFFNYFYYKYFPCTCRL